MGEHDFDAALDAAGLEWIRYRFNTQGGNVTHFTVQYETTIDDRRVPVVRYDNAHGFAHRDLMNRRGEVVSKMGLPEHVTAGKALQIGKQDIQENWQRYRERFLGGER
jgi:hypothetical protein